MPHLLFLCRSLITPVDEVKNFPSNIGFNNWAIIVSFSSSTLGFLVATVSGVILTMAVNEVGDAENVPVLLEWLGNNKLYPTAMFVISIILLFVGVILWLLSVYRPMENMHNWQMWTIIGFIALVLIITTMWFLNFVSSVWLTLGKGEDSLDKGYAKSMATQSITLEELESKLDKYIDDCQGIENINLETFKQRLRVIDPDEGALGDEGEEIIQLGFVTDKLAERLFKDKVSEYVEARKKKHAERTE